jgi:cardiolipin synthase
MNAAEASLKLVEELPDNLVELVINQLRGEGNVAISNPSYQARLEKYLKLHEPVRHELAGMLEVALIARRTRPSVDLVWTGPATQVVAVRQTEHVIFEMIQGAEKQLTVMSFGIFRVPRLIEGMKSAIARAVDVRIVLGERESQAGRLVDQQNYHLGNFISANATVYRWPADRRLRDTEGRAGLMHVKAVVADSNVAFLTSANLTETAFELNMELGVLIRGGHLAESIDRLVDSLLDSRMLQRV